RNVMPRSLAIATSFLLVFATVGIVSYSLAPSITQQARTFAGNIPVYTGYVQSTINDMNRWLARARLSEGVQTQINESINSFIESTGEFLTTRFGMGALYLVSVLPWLVLVPILAFFFLKDAQLFRLAVLRMVPVGDWRSRVEAVMTDVNDTLVAYARAQLISCVLIGVICTVAFYLLGHDYALILGLLAGIFELVPLLGPLTIGIIAVIVAGFESGWQSLATGVFLLVLRIFHDYYTYPRIVREGIHLHPLAVILSVLAGEQVAGIAGVFIAIPIVALATVLYKHILEHTESRGLFTGLLEPKENKDIAAS
ncbi:MAG: AI-2E family transporter, partial [Pyrinomonadaceae bacterium]